MRLRKFFFVIFAMTIMALIYTQMQFNIYALAYNGKEKENEVFKLADENSYVAYNVAKLKSANSLGLELLTEQEDVDFLDNENIVRLETPASLSTEAQVASVAPKLRWNLLASIFSLKSEAEARPIR
ncbi:MAG: hypothetical protein P9M07_03525 [Candidatus Aceula meridiana]|nr:hypothetical protein [Candidatus Aceula meridiana]